MRPVSINGETWLVVRVHPDDPRLFDRTGHLRVATTDPASRVICLSETLTPPLLDKVLLHEIAHAVTMSYDLLGTLKAILPDGFRIFVEEWACNLVEEHALETPLIASEALGREVCVNGRCTGGAK